jgi:hypothetical protein
MYTQRWRPKDNIEARGLVSLLLLADRDDMTRSIARHDRVHKNTPGPWVASMNRLHVLGEPFRSLYSPSLSS